MPAGLWPRVRRRARPPLIWGVVLAILCVVAETLLAVVLKQVAPAHSLGVVYLLGIVAVASFWGIWLGMATAAISTLALDYFVTPPLGTLSLNKGEDWAILTVFLAVTVLAGSISKMGRTLAAEADARSESDLSAELARVLLHAPDLTSARPAGARTLARALQLSSAAIEMEEPGRDDDRLALPLNDKDGAPVAWLLVPSGLPRATVRRLRERLVPSIEVLLQAARERERVTAQQVALRRLATLVAHRAPSEEIFGAVAREVGQVLDARHVAVIRYEPGDMATYVGVWNQGRVATMPLGSRWRVAEGSAAELVARTRAPGRIGPADLAAGSGEVPTALWRMGTRFCVGCPVMVGGRLWGAVILDSTEAPLPEGTEERMADFTELLVTAIVNAEGRAKLEASRARVLAAADATRRLIERDLHDGTQQRLASLVLELRAAKIEQPRDPQELDRLLSRLIRSLDEAIDDLQGIARGLHPALLSRRGLEPAIRALARCSSVPVELNVRVGRLTERNEVTAYYVVSEALANVARHADASVVHVDVIEEDAAIRLLIRDDGTGGADPRQGSGLVGIRDRVEALGGRLDITSPAGGGTSLFAEIPIVSDT